MSLYQMALEHIENGEFEDARELSWDLPFEEGEEIRVQIQEKEELTKVERKAELYED